ncbi:FtsX-like permease family protein [Candidatus Dependentiae bacterium]|nr:FtsX-like permease family protein [Candidatus Dependentiae bacterium]
MNSSLIIKSALRSLNNHKIRAILTTLGVIIGVVSIICVMSIGEGAKYKINKEIEKLGTNFIIVLSSPQRKLNTRGLGALATLTKADVSAIKRECSFIDKISPGIQINGKVIYERSNWRTVIGASNEHYQDIREFKMLDGKFFSAEDVRASSKVAVLGYVLAKELFGTESPLGKKIRIRNRPFVIIGVLDELGKRPDGTDQDDVVMIPITTMVKRIRKGVEHYGAILISAKNPSVIQEASAEIRSILRQSRKLSDNQEDDFTVFSQKDIANASNAAAAVLNLLLFIVASISLIVGGIGIMNIMLVTVTERTREIGIRMAIGATTSNILSQFLLESVTLCLTGGLVGVLLGITGAKLISIFLGWPIFISIKSIVVSMLSTVLIGVFFGYYPAYQASQLKPVEALIEK